MGSREAERLRWALSELKKKMYAYNELQSRQAWLIFEEWKRTAPEKRVPLAHFALSFLPNPMMAKYLDGAVLLQEGIEKYERDEKMMKKTT